jgi:hypothetical protein
MENLVTHKYVGFKEAKDIKCEENVACMEEMMKTYFQENLKIGDYLRDLSIDGRLK